MSSGDRFMPPKTREVNTVINKGTLVDLVAVYLQSISIVHDCDDIIDIEFGTAKDGIVPIKILKKGGKT